MSGSAVKSPSVPATGVGGRTFAPPVRLRAREAHDVSAALRRPVAWGLAGCVALAALTLLAPAAPTYDPWAWIVWGREILHWDLSTGFGPSWKPLPVALTTFFALFGGAAPALWIVAARAGALAGALFAFRLGRRLGGPAAGVAAAAGLLLAPWYLRSAALANSEGLQVAFALAAIDCALARRRPAAFACAVGLGLLRPEAWPFIGLYGLWLARRERRQIPLVAAGLAVLPILWLVPEKLGSGDWLRAAHRAKQPVGHSAAFSDNPVVQVIHEGWYMLDLPIRLALMIGAAVALARRDRRFAVLAALAGSWTVLVAVMTANGYSGNARYLMVPGALAIVIAAGGLVLGARTALGWARRHAPAPLSGRAMALALTTAGALALGWWFVSPWVEPAHQMIRATSWQARLEAQLGPLVEQAGGPGRLRSCGTPVTGAYLVPAVAWRLGVHISDVALVPVRPGVVFRVHTTRDAPAMPTLLPFAGSHGLQTLATSSDWRIVAACNGPA